MIINSFSHHKSALLAVFSQSNIRSLAPWHLGTLASWYPGITHYQHVIILSIIYFSRRVTFFAGVSSPNARASFLSPFHSIKQFYTVEFRLYTIHIDIFAILYEYDRLMCCKCVSGGNWFGDGKDSFSTSIWNTYFYVCRKPLPPPGLHLILSPPQFAVQFPFNWNLICCWMDLEFYA